MQDLNTQLGNLKNSILESLNNITMNLQLQEKNYNQQNSQNRSYLSSIPHNERVLQEIRRKQNITEGLYLYLLQKREEAAISGMASNVAHYKQIDPSTGYGPVEPNTGYIILYTILLGFFLAFGWIYFRGLLNDKIISKEDILSRVSLPLIGQISHVPKRENQGISILERNVAGEQLRSIRTDLSFLLKNNTKKNILVTSCMSDEGKSFVSLNLAAACAMPGKKVALLQFDLRKPVFETNSQFDNAKGLTYYLNSQTDDLSEISHSIKEIPTLHIYPPGSVPSNPADLLQTKNVCRLFEALKEEYDYIVIDTPPVELVSDAFVLAEYSDIALFILRQRVTLKKQLDYIKDVDSSKKFKRIALILNDMKASRKYGLYDYKYEQYELAIKKKKYKVVG
jgi:capsular exopolysaccharide synthesis family protein